MGKRPEVKAHHQRRRPFLRWQSSAERLRRLAQHGKAALCELAQTRIAVERKPCFEHRRIVGGFVACKGEICPTDILEGGEGIGPAVAPGQVETNREQFETPPCDIGEEGVTVAEMPIGRGRTDAGGAGCVRKGEPGRPFFRDQIEGGLDQCLAKVTVVISPPTARSLSRPAHVKGFYFESAAETSSD